MVKNNVPLLLTRRPYKSECFRALGIALFLGTVAVSNPAKAQQPFSYSLTHLDGTSLNSSRANGAVSVGATDYVLGYGNGFVTSNDNRAMAWNLSTNFRTILNRTGLTTSNTYGGVDIGGTGYAVGIGTGSATGNAPRAFAWNLATNARTTLDNTGLDFSEAYGAFNVGGTGYAVGEGTGAVTNDLNHAMAWNLNTNTRIALDRNGLVTSGAKAGVNVGGTGYAVGYGFTQAFGDYNAMAWNLNTNTRIALESTGLDFAEANGAGSLNGVGYAAGNGAGSATANANQAMIWNLSTNTRTILNNIFLTTSAASGIGSMGGAGYAVGYGAGLITSGQTHAMVWNPTTGDRFDVQNLFMPAGTTSSVATQMSANGTIVGSYSGANTVGFALTPFKAWQGDTLDSDQIAKVTNNLTQNTGTTTINGTYEFVSLPGFNTYTLATGGTLQGTGTLIGNLNNTGGVLAPGNSPGTFTIDGDYTQGANAALNIEIADLASFDVLAITGNATLGGTLNLFFAPGFPEFSFAQFDILTTGGTIAGFFGQVNIIGGLPDGVTDYSLTTVSTADGDVVRLSLTAVPEPGALALWGAALPAAGILALARRRKIA